MMDHASRFNYYIFCLELPKQMELVTKDEIDEIHTIAGYLGISSKDYESIKAMFYEH